MLTQQQKEELAKKANDLLYAAYVDYLNGYPILQAQIDYKESMHILVDGFKTVFSQIKKYEPTILSDPYLRAKLIDSSRFPAPLAGGWLIALQRAEQELEGE